eukprot:3883173-Rhodomonas_salina.1
MRGTDWTVVHDARYWGLYGGTQRPELIGQWYNMRGAGAMQSNDTPWLRMPPQVVLLFCCTAYGPPKKCF